MNKSPVTLKGFRDIFPDQKKQRDYVLKLIIASFQEFGFEPLETPTLEPFEIFENQIGEDEKLFYSFTDHGGRKVVLRYDQTVPIARFMGTYVHQLPSLFRRYQIQPVFRAEKPQKGRFREFIQCDADIFGTLSPLADAEMCALSLRIYQKLGFSNITLLLNDRQLLEGIPYPAIVAIDKLEKIGRDGVIADMVAKGITYDLALSYLKQIDTLKPNDTISLIIDAIKAYGFPESWIQFKPTLARSFSYSDGPIWEVVCPDYSGGSLLGGERYNTLVENITGTSVPGTGFAVGFDRTLEAAQQLNLLPQSTAVPQVLVTVFDSTTQLNSLKLAAQLRLSGINTELYPASDKLAKQLKKADSAGIPYAIVLGPDEINLNLVTLKTLATNSQEQLTPTELISKLKS